MKIKLFLLLMSVLTLSAQTTKKWDAYPRVITLGTNDIIMTAWWDGSGWRTNKGILSSNLFNQILNIVSNAAPGFMSGGSAPEGTVVSTGTATTGAIPRYTGDTNIVPSSVILEDAGENDPGIAIPNGDFTGVLSVNSIGGMSLSTEITEGNLLEIKNGATTKFTFDFQGILTLTPITKTERNAITAAEGMICFQSDNTPGPRFYTGGHWTSVALTNDD